MTVKFFGRADDFGFSLTRKGWDGKAHLSFYHNTRWDNGNFTLRPIWRLWGD